jgi:eukaryotic-like serine/threonine-protein kinase
MSHMSGLVAGRYELQERIAAGGMGEVWRALDVVLARPVAVKVLRPDYAGDGETLARFRAEARHAASVTHPGIAQVYDYVETGDAHPPYLVMELVDGPALTGLLARGPLDAATTMDVIAQASAALSAAHAAGLVHRDIKPGNLLIGPGGQVKITDFGIARATGSAPITRTGTLIGTPAYLAPERIAGASATPASDLYSLGILAWECLAGATPFSGREIEVALAHRGLPLPPLPASVPAQVAALIGELTAKDPAARPATADQVARRAELLRDALGPSAFARDWPATWSAPLHGPTGLAQADPDTRTLTDLPLADPQPGSQRRRARPRRAVLVAVPVAVAVVLAGWLVTDVLGSASPARHGQASPSAPAEAQKSPGMVAVSASALLGQPVESVSRELRQEGLQVQIAWQRSGNQQPGSVLSVQPAGPVSVGSTIVVTAAIQPPGHDNGNYGDGYWQGNGNGNGNWQGYGGGGGGG